MHAVSSVEQVTHCHLQLSGLMRCDAIFVHLLIYQSEDTCTGIQHNIQVIILLTDSENSEDKPAV